MNAQIFVVEDDDDIAELITYHLEKQGCSVTHSSDGQSALDAFTQASFDLVILDIMLPVMDGLEVLKRIRYERKSDVPVIIESARGEESDIVSGLEIGADDYLSKPFSPMVLVAKVRSLLRRVSSDRTQKERKTYTETDHLAMDMDKRTCLQDGIPIPLTATEFILLFTLAGEEGRVFTRGQLIATTKGADYPVTERSIDVQIATLRRKLSPRGENIKTVWGVGYKYENA